MPTQFSGSGEQHRTYNNAGWKTGVVYADSTWETFGYDPLSRMTSRADSLGSRTYAYNIQGLLTTVTSAYGTERSISYNEHDQALTETDANGVTVTKTSGMAWLQSATQSPQPPAPAFRPRL